MAGQPLRVLGRGAIGGVLVIALVPALVALRPVSDLEPPEALPRWLVLGLLIAVPAVVGFVGLRRGDPALLVAAGLACLPLMFVSVATFPLVIPALLFLAAARGTRRRSRPLTFLAAVLIVGLVTGSLFGLLSTTETRCWLAYEIDGQRVYRDATPLEAEGPIGGAGGPFAAGCAGGSLTPQGILIATLLGGGAVALAITAPKPRPASAQP
jgi:hypothetical protein